jgi:hypothetical protein
VVDCIRMENVGTIVRNLDLVRWPLLLRLLVEVEKDTPPLSDAFTANLKDLANSAGCADADALEELTLP